MLPLDHPRPPVPSFEREEQRVTVRLETAASIRAFRDATKLPAFAVIHAALNAILCRRTGCHETVIGTLRDGRLLTLRSTLRSGITGLGLLASAAEATADDEPGFRIMLFAGETPPDEHIAGCDLALVVAETEIRCDYDAQLFEPATISQLLDELLTTAEALLGDVTAVIIPHACQEATEQQPAASEAAAQPAHPSSEAEQIITAIWKDALERDDIGPRDNFYDLGGHSLLLTQIRARLSEAFGCKLSITELFEYPTVEALARRVGGVSAELPGPRPTQRESAGGEIAIIGMACRLPGANDIDTFWRNLEQGIESIRFFSDAELLEYGVAPELVANPNYVKARGILDGVDRFDAPFFGYGPREAELIDPQQRLFLHCAWEALERAGYAPDDCSVPVGVYAGASQSSYRPHAPAAEGFDTAEDFQMRINREKDFLPTRVSYKLNLKGPAISVQTACSTSLVAVHLACRGLLAGECDMALAGGASIHLPQVSGYLHQEGMVASSDGHCRTFDAQADGTVFSNGVAVVVLKRLADAIAARDWIHAVIKGSAINNDGSSKVGYTAPGLDGQAAAIAQAQTNAGVDPGSISYIEAHGTGTNLGDPIEVAALTRAFRRGTSRQGFCGIGSLKSNIGHVDVAAGAAGLIKTALALERGKIPPSLHFTTANPRIPFGGSPFRVVDKLADWTRSATPRRAGVSSFGIGGTNAHAVLEEAPLRTEPEDDRPGHLLTLSARTKSALSQLADRFARHLEQESPLPIRDVCFTAGAGRSRFEHRLAVTGKNKDEIRAALLRCGGPGVRSGKAPDDRRRVAFLFTGHGSQWPAMGRELFETEPVFRQEMDRCDEILHGFLGRSIRDSICRESSAEEERLLDEAGGLHAALFAFEYSLCRLWQSWGVEPHALIGHSTGEYVAACIAGVYSLADGLKLIARRGQLMQELPRDGEIVTALCPEARVAEAIRGREADLAVAAVNSPENTVVSGRREAVESVLKELAASGVSVRRLQIAHANHSPLIEPMQEPYRQVTREVEYSPPRIPLVSTVTGDWIEDALATPEHWVRHARLTVRFAAGIETLSKAGYDTFIEIGPKATLLALGQETVSQAGCAWLPSIHPEGPVWKQLLESAGELYVRGAAVDWTRFWQARGGQRVPLPTYPFEGQSLWAEAEVDRNEPSAEKPAGSILEYLQDQVAEIGGLTPERLQEDSLVALGFDSLRHMALRRRILRDLNIEISLAEMLDSPDLGALAELLSGRLSEDSVEEITI